MNGFFFFFFFGSSSSEVVVLIISSVIGLSCILDWGIKYLISAKVLIGL